MYSCWFPGLGFDISYMYTTLQSSASNDLSIHMNHVATDIINPPLFLPSNIIVSLPSLGRDASKTY
jgi:hypothetical protein